MLTSEKKNITLLSAKVVLGVRVIYKLDGESVEYEEQAGIEIEHLTIEYLKYIDANHHLPDFHKWIRVVETEPNINDFKIDENKSMDEPKEEPINEMSKLII